MVIGISNLSRTVKYDELLDEKGNSKLTESIPITEAIEGLHRRRHVSSTYRGRIRPLPSLSNPQPCDSELSFGVCVDAFFRDAWWEGVIFDAKEDAMERSVYFPDEGDERKFSLDNLRPSRVWDEFSGAWEDCGIWVFLELVRELDWSMPSSKYAKMLWLSLQSNYGFKKMISEWKCGSRSLWKKYLKDVLCERGRKLGIKDPACKKLVGYKTRRKRHKLENPQHIEVDSNLPDTVVQLKSSRGLSAVELTKNGGVSILNKSRARTMSVPLRLNVRKPNRPVVPTAGDPLVLSESLSLEEDVISYATSFLSDPSSEEEYSKTSTTTCCLSNHRINRASIPIGIGQSGKLKHREDKWELPKSCHGSNRLKGLQLREENIAEGASCSAEINHSIGRAGVKKLMKRRRNFGALSSGYTQKELSCEASVIAGAKIKTSCKRRKIKKGICRANANIKPPLIQEDRNGLHIEQSSFSCQRRNSPLFEDYGRNCRLKDMVSRPWKRKRKRQPNIPQGGQGDTICFICYYGGELISCKNCCSSYHLTCLGTQVQYLHVDHLLGLSFLQVVGDYNWLQL